MNDRALTIITEVLEAKPDIDLSDPTARNQAACAILTALTAARTPALDLPEPDDTPDIGPILNAVQEGLEQIGAVVTVREDDDDPGTPGIITPSGAVCMYDLNNEISSAFHGFISERPEQVRKLGIDLLAAQ